MVKCTPTLASWFSTAFFHEFLRNIENPVGTLSGFGGLVWYESHYSKNSSSHLVSSLLNSARISCLELYRSLLINQMSRLGVNTFSLITKIEWTTTDSQPSGRNEQRDDQWVHVPHSPTRNTLHFTPTHSLTSHAHPQHAPLHPHSPTCITMHC